MKPFLKWVGGKQSLIPQLEDKFPFAFGAEVTRYVEPFLGGGAVMFHLLEQYPRLEVIASDVNIELISCYRTVRDYPTELLTYLHQLEDTYLAFDTNQREKFFYTLRQSYNSGILTVEAVKNLLPLEKDMPRTTRQVTRAALFIFLNKTCFNGLYRVNKKGEFNTPHGKYKNPRLCDADTILACSELLKRANLFSVDYTDLTQYLTDTKPTFVYFDPPYRPLSVTSNFTSYNRANFNDLEQERLASFIRSLMVDENIYIAASNSDSKQPDGSSYFRGLYGGTFNYTTLRAKRSINSDGNKRGEINEILLTNY